METVTAKDEISGKDTELMIKAKEVTDYKEGNRKLQENITQLKCYLTESQTKVKKLEEDLEYKQVYYMHYNK